MSREDDREKLLARREREGFIPEAGFIDRYPGSGLPPSLQLSKATLNRMNAIMAKIFGEGWKKP